MALPNVENTFLQFLEIFIGYSLIGVFIFIQYRLELVPINKQIIIKIFTNNLFHGAHFDVVVYRRIQNIRIEILNLIKKVKYAVDIVCIVAEDVFIEKFNSRVQMAIKPTKLYAKIETGSDLVIKSFIANNTVAMTTKMFS